MATSNGWQRTGLLFLAGLVLGGTAGALAAWQLREKPAGSRAAARPDAPVPALDHARFMRRAIEMGKKAPRFPFGAVIVDARTGEILAEGYNHTADSPTFHGEVDVINRLAASPKRPGDWSSLVLYTTAEPCPMCQSAIEWSGIGTIVYDTSIPFLQQHGWSQIDIRADEVIRRSFRQTALLGGVLEEECNALFQAGPPSK